LFLLEGRKKKKEKKRKEAINILCKGKGREEKRNYVSILSGRKRGRKDEERKRRLRRLHSLKGKGEPSLPILGAGEKEKRSLLEGVEKGTS